MRLYCRTNLADTTHLHNVWAMLAKCRRRWGNIGQTLGRCVVIVKVGEMIFKVGGMIFKVGEMIFKVGEMIQMTLSFIHMQDTKFDLRPDTLPLVHRGSSQYWFFTTGKEKQFVSLNISVWGRTRDPGVRGVHHNHYTMFLTFWENHMKMLYNIKTSGQQYSIKH